ncbi:transcriptional regulator with XRE-family HTH domain [Kibdelosporangium banguiense]|uniref:Transcriptional regulator with XRE-family HTH domain n=1 Tax=Kibdelosporangium banguiense TaxID=1365924 RepID=A0ABS4THS4_9PSEU|nr:helix-turn-helix transcriptional regulator [Kibdelosporangium banguiense]MBP2323987.1 transcriptional regulator with XRE-family HTH domain [Kibdelosporangium banguiense]
MSVLLREAIGDRLRHARTIQRRTLREVSRTARVSLGYLSEVERGQKEASSELLAAICDALELPMPELLYNVANDMSGIDPSELLEPAINEQPAPSAPASSGSGDASMSAAGLDGGALVPEELLAAGELLGAGDIGLDGLDPMDTVVGDTLSDLRIQPALSHRIGPEIARARVFAA